MVRSREEADAVVKQDGGLWVTGYVSADPRSPSTTRQPIFQGFLSVELIGKDNDPLWSYLVTPSKFRAGDITNDLADHLAEKLLEARKGSEAVRPAQVREPPDEIVLTAAGATFPAPLYQKWFASFHERHPNLVVKYSPVGSEAGIQQLMSGKLDFAASDVPLSDARGGRKQRELSCILHR